MSHHQWALLLSWAWSRPASNGDLTGALMRLYKAWEYCEGRR